MICLFTNIYTPTDERRQREISSCLRLNARAGFDAVIPMTGRPTFRDMFTFANLVIEPDDVAIFANADIYFDRLALARTRRVRSNECFALTRYDIHQGKPLFHASPRSQDVWAFRGRIRIPQSIDFPMGHRGCDNRLAHELQAAGYKVRNPSLTIRTFHLHETGIRAADYHAQLVPGPYCWLPFERLEELDP